MITYISLIISGLLGLLGLFLKTTKDVQGKKGENFKKLTASGWIVLLIMLSAISISIITQKNKDAASQIARLQAEQKDSLNVMRIQQLLDKAKQDSIVAKQQIEFLSQLFNSSKRIDTLQKVAMRKSDQLNQFLKDQLADQKIQNQRLMNPIETFLLKYQIIIPADQPKVKAYADRIFERIKTGVGYDKLLLDTSLAPNGFSEDEVEYEFASFVSSINHLFYFLKEKQNVPHYYFKPNLYMRFDTIISKNEMIKAEKQYGIAKQPISLRYDHWNKEFVLELEIYPKTQHSNMDILSLNDFSNIYVYFIAPKSDESLSKIQYRFNDLQLITKSGRRLRIYNFTKNEIGQHLAQIPANAVFK